ncbi:long-chain-fatty-acid--CoA ligase [Nocardia sp. CA-151230]|uniref:long-chain-fatty-acid--CoA ligase n=1 Tax=Nocardia sp. CA-151230 TaxID=3239982 RepID=UPI003D8F2BC4
MLNLSMLLEDTARRHPDRAALVLGDQRYTYSRTEELANQVANLLVANGIQPGDKIALSCPNLPWFPIAYYGILKAGAVVVPLNILLKGREIAYHLTDAEAKAYICHAGTPDLPIGEYARAGFDQTPTCEQLFVVDDTPPAAGEEFIALPQALAGQPSRFDTVVREATDTAVILYTSGTTGHPKGAELSHANMVLNALAANRQFDASPARPDTHLATLPLFHSFGQTVNMNAGFATAATIVLLPRFDAATALDLIRAEQITVFAGVPTMFWGLLQTLHDTTEIAPHLRLAISGGAALPVEILTRFTERFGVAILEGYGLSETSPLAIFSSTEHRRPGSIGKPMWGIDIRLIDDDWNTVAGENAVGEIAIRGHNIMKGYHNRPQATAEAIRQGWFRSGDLAYRDADGFYYVVDRAKDMIVRGGLNVYPREIEELLMTHDGVSLAAVVGIPHDSHGEEIKAYVIPTPGTCLTEAELIAWSKQQVAAYKYPRYVEFVQTLPMTATGKILKRELRTAQ